MNIYGVIMAGGGGTRFWPLSRKEKPKQLLNLSGKEIMINEAIDRILQITSKNNVYIVTNEVQARLMEKVTINRMSKSHILREPSARNTAACIGYAAIKILKEKGDGIMVVTPADHYIKDSKKFAKVLQKAAETADSTSEIVTIGITPTFPSTGYGYIHYRKGEDEVKKAIEFVEKPNEEKAKQYIASGDYAWNSGIFVWKASTVLEKFKKYLPNIYKDLMKISDSIGTKDEDRILQDIYPQIESISIDYGVMEKADDIWVIPAEFGWNDVGSWDMLNVLHDEDENGNICVGNTVVLNSKNSIVYSSGKMVTAYGIDNLIVVETKDAIMVLPKDKAQDVKKIVDELKAKNKTELL